jgi:hypothetical protein
MAIDVPCGAEERQSGGHWGEAEERQRRGRGEAEQWTLAIDCPGRCSLHRLYTDSTDRVLSRAATRQYPIAVNRPRLGIRVDFPME